MILAKMKEIAESYLGYNVTDAVVAVPAHFATFQRQAIEEAGTTCGLNILRTLNEHSAAALAYAFEKSTTDERNILILDLGGGTSNATLAVIEDGTIEIKATAGDSQLGGENFDANLVNYFATGLRQTYKKDLSSDPRAHHRLRTACESAKRALSSATSTHIEIDHLFKGIDFRTYLTRNRFEELCEDLFQRVADLIERVLRDSRTDKANVHEVVLVGGSTRIPRIAGLVSTFFNGKEPMRGINPDEAIAYGAAVHAAIYSGCWNSRGR